MHLLVTRLGEVSREPSLWKLSIFGGTPQLLMENATDGAVSPDGFRIAYLPGARVPDQESALHTREAGSELWSMDSDGTNPRKIAAAEISNEPIWRSRIMAAVWSPHGQRIAYMERRGPALCGPGQDSFSLQSRNASGGDPQVMSNDSRMQPALSWVQDGRILYAHREDPGSERDDQEIRSIKVDERTGKPIGQPQTVSRGQGAIGGLSGTSDGKRLVLWRINTEGQAFISEFAGGSQRLKAPRRMTLDMNGNVAEAWAPDSKSVFIVSNRNGTWKLFRQAIDQTTAEVLVEGKSMSLPRLSADGSQVFYLSYLKPENTPLPIALMRVPLAGGPPQLVTQALGITNYQCTRAPSALCILSRQEGAKNTFLSFDTEHGTGRELTTVDSVTNWSLSPDGSRLALFLDSHRIRILSLATGAAHDLNVVGWHLESGDWSADGKELFVPSITARSTPAILAVNQMAKAEVILEGNANIHFNWLLQSPDGRYGILEAEVPGDNNVWMVEHF